MKTHRKRGLKDRAKNALKMAPAALVGYMPFSAKAEPIVEGDTLVYTSQKEYEEESPDFNLDGKVNFADFLDFASHFNSTNERYDLTEDGRVDFPDFLEFVDSFNKDVIVREPALPALKPIAPQSIDQVEAVINQPQLNLADAVPQELKDMGVEYSLRGTNGLKVSLEDSTLTYRPFRNFDGDSYVRFGVTPVGRDTTLEEEVSIEVKENEEARIHYEKLTRDNPQKRWAAPFDTVLVYTGPAKAPGDDDHPSTWTGPTATEQRIAWAKKHTTDTLYELTSGFFKKQDEVTFILTDDPEEFWTNTYPWTVYWDDTLRGNPNRTGGTFLRPVKGELINSVDNIFRTTSEESTYPHEAGNGIGLTDANSEDYWSIMGDGDYPLEDVKEENAISPHKLDIFVGTSYYDN